MLKRHGHQSTVQTTGDVQETSVEQPMDTSYILEVEEKNLQ